MNTANTIPIPATVTRPPPCAISAAAPPVLAIVLVVALADAFAAVPVLPADFVVFVDAPVDPATPPAVVVLFLLPEALVEVAVAREAVSVPVAAFLVVDVVSWATTVAASAARRIVAENCILVVVWGVWEMLDLEMWLLRSVVEELSCLLVLMMLKILL